MGSNPVWGPKSFTFSVSKLITKSGEIELRSGRPCINTNSYLESKLLYEVVCGSPFFRKLTQLASLTNLSKGQYKDVLNDIKQAEQLNQESKFSFLFIVVSDVYSKLEGKISGKKCHVIGIQRKVELRNVPVT